MGFYIFKYVGTLSNVVEEKNWYFTYIFALVRFKLQKKQKKNKDMMEVDKNT